MHMSNTNIKPNLFIPGAAKSGTSSLHDYLNLHPHIYMSSVKEPHYFIPETNICDKITYYNLFEGSKDFKYRGESSTAYMVFNDAIENIKSETDSPKFIFILRNPIDRCFSHYSWVRGLALEDKGFVESVKHDMDLVPDPANRFGGGYKYYFQFGLYYKWISKYYDAFGRENILIITTEALKKNPNLTLNQAFDFLGLELLDDTLVIESNKTIHYEDNIQKVAAIKSFKRKIQNSILYKYNRRLFPDKMRDFLRNMLYRYESQVKSKSQIEHPQKIDDNTREWLRNLYHTDVKQLKQMCGQSVTEWIDFK